MKTKYLSFFLVFACFVCCVIRPVKGQSTNTFVFTNKYKEAIQVEVRRVDSDGIIYSLITGVGGGKVFFTNLPVELQVRFGYDAEKVRKANEYQARILAAQLEAQQRQFRIRENERIERERLSQPNSIQNHKFYIRPISESDFPKTEKVQTVCKEIASELKGINKAIELGLNYAKFSDLLTEKVLDVEKIKDLRGEGIPYSFLTRVDQCEDAYKESRDWWHKQIENSEYPTLKAYEDYVMRKYWSEASVRLTYCIGIAESNTNANSAAIDQVALMIKIEQLAVKEGVLETKDYLDPTVSNLTVDEISDRLKASLAAPNSPSTKTQP